MSKLAHSHQPTMDEIDRLRAIAEGNEDLVPPLPLQIDQSTRNARMIGEFVDLLYSSTRKGR